MEKTPWVYIKISSFTLNHLIITVCSAPYRLFFRKENKCFDFCGILLLKLNNCVPCATLWSQKLIAANEQPDLGLIGSQGLTGVLAHFNNQIYDENS